MANLYLTVYIIYYRFVICVSKIKEKRLEHIVYCVIAVLAGLIGVSLTVFDLPGNTMMLIATFAFAFFTDRQVEIPYLLFVLLVYLLGEIWEAGMSLFGIKKEKVSWGAVFFIGIGGFIGTVIGTGVFPLLGSFIGGCIGAYLAAFTYTYLNCGSRENAFYIAWQAAKVRFLAMLGKITAAFVLAVSLVYMVISK